MHSLKQFTLSTTVTMLVFLGGLVHAQSAAAATYYVATNGSDSYSCSQAQSTSTPKRTIGSGVRCLVGGNGDKLYIRGGTYAESIGQSGVYPPSGSSWTNAATIAGYPGETVVLTGASSAQSILLATGSGRWYVIFENLILDARGKTGGMYLGTDSHHIRFRDGEIKNGNDGMLVTGGASFVEVLNSKIHDMGEGNCSASAGVGTCYGFYMTGHDNLFDGNHVYNNGGYGFHIYNSGQSNVSNNIIRNNVIYGNGFDPGITITAAAIILSSGSNNQAYNNVIFNNSNGIQLDYSPAGARHKVYNNTIYGNTSWGITNGTDGAEIKNNIIYGNGIPIQKTGTNTAWANNLCSASGTGCTLVGDPKFTNASTRDFTLQSTSAAIDRGVTISTVTTDYSGVARPQGAAYDIGASEYRSTTTTAPAAPTNVRILRD